MLLTRLRNEAAKRACAILSTSPRILSVGLSKAENVTFIEYTPEHLVHERLATCLEAIGRFAVLKEKGTPRARKSAVDILFLYGDMRYVPPTCHSPLFTFFSSPRRPAPYIERRASLSINYRSRIFERLPRCQQR